MSFRANGRTTLLGLVLLVPVAAADLTVDDVIALLQARVPEQVVLARIKNEAKAFKLSTQDIINLKNAGATERVFVSMMDPTTATSLSTATAGRATTATASASAVEGFSFTEPGVYYKKKGEWMEILPEVVNWKTGGALKNLASAGVVKKDVNGLLNGPHSRNSVTSPLELIISMPEGVAITEYQLIRLRPNKDYREFLTVTGGVFNQQGGAMRDLVPFEARKVTARIYSFVLPSTLGAADYGLIHMGATGGSGGVTSLSMGRMYTFRLIE